MAKNTVETSKKKKKKNWDCLIFLTFSFSPPLDCDKSCLNCSDHRPSSCLSCPTGRRKDADGHCVWFKMCAERHFKDQDGECKQCNDRCHLCLGSGPNQCLSCEEPYFLLSEFSLLHNSPQVGCISKPFY